MFSDSKYTTWYFNLVYSRKIRIIDTDYYESHHIIPTSLGGIDAPENTVLLTYREHIIVHYLLTKMCLNKRDRGKMLKAFHAMVFLQNEDNKRTRKLLPLRYLEKAKKSIIEAKIGSKHSEETRKKIGESRIYPKGEIHPFFSKKHTDAQETY